MRYRDIIEPFDKGTITDGVIALMHPKDFLDLAPPIADRIPSSQRLLTIRRLLDSNTKLSHIPVLEFEVDGGKAFVVGHDGRHRAIELRDRGAKVIPVWIEGINPTTVDLIYPEPHDDDDDYPGHDEESLHDRQKPLPVSVLGEIITAEELLKRIR